MHKYFDSLLKEINIEYRTTTVNFANYPYLIFTIIDRFPERFCFQLTEE